MPSLPDPMLSRPGREVPSAGYAYEVKWDGFRAIVSTSGGLRVRGRKGWNMTALVRELADLSPGLVLDGELVAWATTASRAPLACANGCCTESPASQ